MHLHFMAYNYSLCYLQNRAYYDNIYICKKKNVPMVPRKYKPAIEKYHSLTIVIFNQPNNCIHSNNICQKTILENEKKNCLPNSPYHCAMPEAVVDY